MFAPLWVANTVQCNYHSSFKNKIELGSLFISKSHHVGTWVGLVRLTNQYKWLGTSRNRTSKRYVLNLNLSTSFFQGKSEKFSFTMGFKMSAVKDGDHLYSVYLIYIWVLASKQLSDFFDENSLSGKDTFHHVCILSFAWCLTQSACLSPSVLFRCDFIYLFTVLHHFQQYIVT